MKWTSKLTNTSKRVQTESDAASEVEDHRSHCSSHQLGNKEHGGEELVRSQLNRSCQREKEGSGNTETAMAESDECGFGRGIVGSLEAA